MSLLDILWDDWPAVAGILVILFLIGGGAYFVTTHTPPSRRPHNYVVVVGNRYIYATKVTEADGKLNYVNNEGEAGWVTGPVIVTVVNPVEKGQ